MPSRRLTFHQEIREAIIARERLVLVVGPRCESSEYVRQEWQFALQYEKVVTPVLRLGDYPLLPDELRLVHTEDFRDDSRFNFHLDNLVRQLSEPVPSLGQLIGVPSLPPHYLARAERLNALRDALRVDLDQPVVIGGAAARVGVHGMGGIGKSVLAAALARDRKVREAFPDGIVWVPLGTLPDVPALQRRVHRDLGGDGAFDTEHQGRQALTELLADRSVLLVLDDVWRREDVDSFDVLAPRSRTLLTTRDMGLLLSLGGANGVRHIVDLLTDDEAFGLLALVVGVLRDRLPSEAAKIVAECGRLPLAVALCGGMIRRGLAWGAVLQQLRQARIDRIADRHAVEPHHQSVWHAIHVSVEFLPGHDRQRFIELAVFPSDEAIPEPAALALWAQTGQFDEWSSQELLTTLVERSLVQTTSSTTVAAVAGQARRFWLHDLILDYLRHRIGDLRPLHDTVLAAYANKCGSGWPSGPNDGYFFEHLLRHLNEAGRIDEAVQLLCDLRWVAAKCGAGLTYALIADYESTLNALPELQQEHDSESRRLEQLRQYSADLVVYASARLECLPLPAPPDTRLVQESIRRANGTSLRTKESKSRSIRSERILAFAAFVSMHGHQLNRFPEQSLSIAFNQAASGLVTEQAETLLDSLKTPWMRRSPRPAPLTDKALSLRTLIGHTAEISAVGLTPDGRTCVSGSADNTVCVWDVATGALLRTLAAHSKDVRSVAITPDAKIAVSGSADATVCVWDVRTGLLLRTLTGDQDVLQVAITADGKTVVSGHSDSTIRAWDVVTGAPMRTFTSHAADLSFPPGVWALAITPDGRTCVSADADRLCVWNVPKGELVRTLDGHTEWVMAAALTPDGCTVVSGGEDGTLRVWDTATGEQLRMIAVPASRVEGVALTPDGRTAICVDDDSPVTVWNIVNGAILRDTKQEVWSSGPLAIAADGQMAVLGDNVGKLVVWDLTGQAPARLPRHDGRVNSVVLTRDGRTAVSIGVDETLFVWDVATGMPRRKVTGLGQVNDIALAPDGRTAVLGGKETPLRFLDITSGELLWTFPHRAQIFGLAIASENCIALSGEHNGIMRLWDIFTGRVVAVLECHTDISSVDLSRDGRTAVSACRDNTVRLWDLDSRRLLRTLRGHTSWVNDVALAPNGHTAISGSADKTVRLWDVSTGRLLHTLVGHTGYVQTVTFSADGRHAISAGWDYSVRVWKTATGELITIYPLQEWCFAVAGGAGDRVIIGTLTGEVHFLTLCSSAIDSNH